jgi:tRNA-binding protein
MTFVLSRLLKAMESLKKVDFRLGTIVSVKPNTKAKNPSFIVDIDFGSAIGKKTTSAQLPANYTQQELASKQVICVVNFPTKRIAGFKSEVLVVGFPDDNSKVILLNTRNVKFPNGTQIRYLSSSQNTDSSSTTEATDDSAHTTSSASSNSNALPETTYEMFEAAGITVGTIKRIETQENSNQATFTVDFGEELGSKTLVIPNLSSDVTYQVESQLPVAISPQTNEIIPLGIAGDNDLQSVVVLGVDRQVPNGGKLF